MKSNPVAVIHSMPRTVGDAWVSISISGSIVAQDFCNNPPRMLPPSGPEKRYLDTLAAGRFEIQKCAGCGKHVFYPRVLCPHCGADRLDWAAPSGRGTVYSTTVVRRKPADGGDYNVALVDLAEGVRMMSRVVTIAPGEVRIGMAVRARIAEGLVEFVPA
jgi:uncharacterized OB-fold protein